MSVKDVLEKVHDRDAPMRVIEFVHGTRDGERYAFPLHEAGEVHVFEDGEAYRRRTDHPEQCRTTDEIGVFHYDLLSLVT